MPRQCGWHNGAPKREAWREQQLTFHTITPGTCPFLSTPRLESKREDAARRAPSAWGGFSTPSPQRRALDVCFWACLQREVIDGRVRGGWAQNGVNKEQYCLTRCAAKNQDVAKRERCVLDVLEQYVAVIVLARNIPLATAVFRAFLSNLQSHQTQFRSFSNLYLVPYTTLRSGQRRPSRLHHCITHYSVRSSTYSIAPPLQNNLNFLFTAPAL